MIIMALDHVRDFIHRGAMSFSPTDLSQTTPVLFFTRWITHFCAPVFMFTAGMGAFLWWRNGRTRGQLSTFLLTRGFWLIVLELTVMQIAYDFGFSKSNPILLVVLWALGACMVVLAALVWLPESVLAIVSVGMIALHNLGDGVTSRLWISLHQSGAIVIGGMTVVSAYPLIPWIGVMALGFCFGRLYTIDAGRRERILLTTGTAMIAAFLVLRWMNVYGDPVRWSAQKLPALSFLNCTKYPPSLDFLLMTLGPAMFALVWFERHPPAFPNPLIVFGRVPLFYFVLHFFAAHLIAAALALLRYGSPAWSFIFHPIPSMGGPRDLFPSGFGYDLWVAYAVWISIVVGLYPLCRRFAMLKASRRDWWLSYL